MIEEENDIVNDQALRQVIDMPLAQHQRKDTSTKQSVTEINFNSIDDAALRNQMETRAKQQQQ